MFVMKLYHKPSIKGFIKNYWNFLFVIRTARKVTEWQSNQLLVIHYWLDWVIDCPSTIRVCIEKNNPRHKGSFTSYEGSRLSKNVNFYKVETVNNMKSLDSTDWYLKFAECFNSVHVNIAHETSCSTNMN